MSGTVIDFHKHTKPISHSKLYFVRHSFSENPFSENFSIKMICTNAKLKVVVGNKLKIKVIYATRTLKLYFGSTWGSIPIYGKHPFPFKLLAA